MSWRNLERGNRELTEYGAGRLASNHVSYLGTVRKDGSPRVHPMTPFVGEGHLLFFTSDGSLFYWDQLRDGSYALSRSVETRLADQVSFFYTRTGHAHR